MKIEKLDGQNLKQSEEKSRQITFQCKCCGNIQPLSVARRNDRFFPPTITCSDCYNVMQ
jgi:hypothetical protein